MTDRLIGDALKRAHPGVDDPDGRRLRREARTGARIHDSHRPVVRAPAGRRLDGKRVD